MKPFRYNAIHTRRGLLSTIRNFVATGRWDRTKTDFTPVAPGDPGYEAAKYESIIIYRSLTPQELKEHSF